jgi:hypothetical protein
MIDISHNMAAFERQLSNALQEQLPFALALALNDAGGDAKEAVEDHMDRVFDRPTPFTKRALFMRRASKRRPTVEVNVKQVQARYLRRQAEGGIRTPEGAALLVPVGQRLNRYGNMPRGAVRRILGRSDTFVASRRGGGNNRLRPGIYKRKKVRGKNASPQLLVAFEDRATYQRRFLMQTTAERAFRASFEGHLSRRLRQAWATRRP